MYAPKKLYEFATTHQFVISSLAGLDKISESQVDQTGMAVVIDGETIYLDNMLDAKDVKAGKIDFKVDKFGIIHTSIGKVSFDSKMINENALELLNFIQKLKPSSAKGIYVKSVSLSSTMSSSIKIDSSVLID